MGTAELLEKGHSVFKHPQENLGSLTEPTAFPLTDLYRKPLTEYSQ